MLKSSIMFKLTLYKIFTDLGYFVKSPYKLSRKIQVLTTWLKILFKFFFISNFIKIKTEKIFDFKVQAFDYETIKFLFEEIFIRNEYFFESKDKSPVIFDCGSNIGFATIYFKWVYPNSTIYAFEPDKNTFKILEKNIKNNDLNNVFLYNKAISNTNGKLNFFTDSNRPGSLIMSSKIERGLITKNSVECISLTSFIKDKKISKIDFLKMDIEGSEKEAINDLNQKNILKIVDKMCIEYHHKVGNEKSNLGSFLKVFESNNFEYQIEAMCIPISSKNVFQDVIIYLYRN